MMPSVTMHLAKELAEMARRPILRMTAGRVSGEAAGLAAEIRRKGFAILPSHWSAAKCDAAAAAVDSLCEMPGTAGEWVDPEGCDHRFFRAEKHVPLLNDFLNDPLIEEIRRAYTGRRSAEKFVLAARMRFRAGNKGSGGGWHLDSPHTLQFKAIMYLSDCGSDNGPFELIPGTHDRRMLLGLLAQGRRKPGQYRFTDSEVDPIVAGGHSVKTFTAQRGSVILADVTALHRGAPIRSGSRYALTLYCGDPRLGGEI